MAVGEWFQSESASWYDAETGYRIIQPIREDANRHMYFTSNPFTATGRELIFSAVREGVENYYLLEFLTGRYRQLTDVRNLRVAHAYYDRASDSLYYGDAHRIFRVHVHTCETEQIYESAGAIGSLAVTADGKYLVTFAQTAMEHHGNDAEDVFEVPMWRIFRVDIQTGKEKTILYRNARVDHIQCCPSDPAWLMYCLWGYQCTHQRIWHCNLDGTDGGPVGHEKPNEHRTHEYYTPDGQHIAFHGKKYTYGDTPSFQIVQHTWGICGLNGEDERIYAFPPGERHAVHSIMSHDGTMVAADGQTFISLLDRDDATMTCTLRPIARHDSTMSGNFVHPHPSFSPDDRYVVFATDRGGKDRGNICLIDLWDKR